MNIRNPEACPECGSSAPTTEEVEALYARIDEALAEVRALCSDRETIRAERDRLNANCTAWAADLIEVGIRCEIRDGERPLDAVVRVIAERDRLLSSLRTPTAETVGAVARALMLSMNSQVGEATAYYRKAAESAIAAVAELLGKGG